MRVIRGEEVHPKIECGPRPATSDRMLRGFLLCLLSPLGGGVNRFDPMALALPKEFRVPHQPKPTAAAQSCDRAPAIVADGQQPGLFSRTGFGGGGRNARATSTRFHVCLEDPPVIHPRKSPAAAGSAAITRRAQEPHVSLDPLSLTTVRHTTQKGTALVKKLWRMRVLCGRVRKTKELFCGASPVLLLFNNLDNDQESWTPLRFAHLSLGFRSILVA
jgi:hypothetical protein